MKWLKFAFLNTLRNRRRSLVTVAIAGLGTAGILLGGGFALYTYESLAQAAARTTGHLIVSTPEFTSQEEDTPLQFGISDWEALGKRLMADPQVRNVLPSVSFGGLISNGEKSIVMVAQGVDPRSEFKVKGPFLRVVSGTTLEGGSKTPQVLLGEGAARSLKTKPGSSLTMLATTTDGALNALDVQVQGIVSTGVPELDRRLVYADIGSAQRLLQTDKVSSVGVFLARMDDTDAALQRLQASNQGLQVRTWREEAFFYASVRSLYNRIFGALGLIITVIVVFVVTNAMAMAIVERTREIGTLRAIGTAPGQLVSSLALEGSMLGVAGALAGAAVAGAVTMLLYIFSVQMPPPPGRSSSYPLYINADPSLYAITIIAMVALATLASALVARRTVSLPITTSLAHT